MSYTMIGRLDIAGMMILKLIYTFNMIPVKKK